MIKITLEQWNKISNDYKGKWERWIKDDGWQPNLPEEFIGKRTVFSGCITGKAGTDLLTEGKHFKIVG